MDKFRMANEFDCPKCGSRKGSACTLTTGLHKGKPASTCHNERLHQATYAVTFLEVLDGESKENKIKLIEAEQRRHKAAWDRMAWLNKLHFDALIDGD